ncbi:hypothetical protein BGX28_008332 [Mortierella sp. GBA30]|nr:hypothetical protein BGX28_008332 [Mortierella sp. GBA30]
MTTAARPTFDPARGKGSQAPTRIYSSRDLASHTKLKFRQSGQTTQNELNRLDLKAQLQKAEQEHFEKVNKVTKLASGLSNTFKDDDNLEDRQAESTTTETPLERKRRLLKEAERLDKDDSDDDEKDSDDSDESDSDSDDDDDEDDTAELLRELEKIKRERAEEKERLERLQREEEEKEREAQVAAGNPLLDMPGGSSGPKDFSVKRRWDDDVVFKNQARGMDDKPKKRFINDTLRSDFHRKFMNKYRYILLYTDIMAKDGFLTAKAVANRIKAKGLQKLRWYCQICEKQCRDENGFKCHCASESHQRKILLVAESPEKYVNDYSAEFQRDFMKLLSTRYGTRRVNANLVYQEFISDRTHLHMNATKWSTLSEFTKHLGKEGLAIVDETPKGWFMQWVDNSPKTLARQEAIAKKERMEMDDEQREQKMIQQQIQAEALRKQQAQQQEAEQDEAATELVRENEEEKIKLDISIKPVGLSLGGPKLGGPGTGLLKPKSLNALATKKPNPFSSKTSASASSTAPAGSPTSSTSPASVTSATQATKKRSAVEEIIEKEMARKKRLAEMSSNGQYSARPDFQGSSRGSSSGDRERTSRFDERGPEKERARERERDRDHDRSRGYDGDNNDRDYRSSRDSRDSRDDRDYRSSRDDRSSRDYRDRDYERDRNRDKEEDRYRDRESHRDRDREHDRQRSRS